MVLGRQLWVCNHAEGKLNLHLYCKFPARILYRRGFSDILDLEAEQVDNIQPFSKVAGQREKQLHPKADRVPAYLVHLAHHW